MTEKENDSLDYLVKTGWADRKDVESYRESHSVLNDREKLRKKAEELISRTGLNDIIASAADEALESFVKERQTETADQILSSVRGIKIKIDAELMAEELELDMYHHEPPENWFEIRSVNGVGRGMAEIGCAAASDGKSIVILEPDPEWPAEPRSYIWTPTNGLQDTGCGSGWMDLTAAWPKDWSENEELADGDWKLSQKLSVTAEPDIRGYLMIRAEELREKHGFNAEKALERMPKRKKQHDPRPFQWKGDKER